MTFVSSALFPTQGVEGNYTQTMIVKGDWVSLNMLAHQVKWAARDCTLVLLDGGKDAARLIITGQMLNHAHDLVTQRIEEGFEVELEYGQEYRVSCLYTYTEPATTQDEGLDLKDHPF